MHEIKAQSAVEMMTTYSWAYLIVAIFVAIVLVLVGSPSGQPSLPATCTIQPLLPCSDTVLTNYSSSSGIIFYISFVNDLQNPIIFPYNAFNLTTSGIGVVGTAINHGQCQPSFALIGGVVICKVNIPGSVSPTVGTKVNTAFTISYRLCQRNTQTGCPTSVYKSSGYSTESVAPANIVFYTVTLVANEVNGLTAAVAGANAIIYLNGIPYATSQNALLTATGNYNIFATVPAGYAYSTWAVNSISSTVTPINSLISVLTVKSNAIVIATSTNLACYTCYTTAAPSLVCPSTCLKTSATITYPNGQGTYTCAAGSEGCT